MNDSNCYFFLEKCLFEIWTVTFGLFLRPNDYFTSFQMLLFSIMVADVPKEVVTHYNPYTETSVSQSSTHQQIIDSQRDFLKGNKGTTKGQENKARAFEVLADTNLRRIYDLFGVEAFAERLHNPTNNRTGVNPLYQVSRPIRTYVFLSMKDFYVGTTQQFIFERQEVCICDNNERNRHIFSFQCPLCGGHVTKQTPFKVIIEVAPGTFPGKIYKFPGLLDTSETYGGGDLEVQVLLRDKDNNFRRDNYNLIIEVPISAQEARTGCTRTVTLPDGSPERVTFKRDKSTLTEGKGFPIPGTSQRGDLICIPRVSKHVTSEL